MKSQARSKADQIKSSVIELHPLDCWKSFWLCHQRYSFSFDWIFLKLVDKRIWMKSQTSSKTGQIGSLLLELHPFDCWKSLCLTVISISHSVLIRSFWNLQIRWTWMKSQTRWKTGHIGSLILELHPLDCWKASDWLCHQCYSFSFDRLFLKLADRWTWMKSLTSLKTGQIGSLVLELHSLNCWKSLW